MSKKLSLILVVMVAAWINVCAQPIVSYDFASSLGTYTAITDGTVMTNVVDDEDNNISFDNNLWVTTTATTEAFSGQAFPIGFDFVYNNQTMNQFAITSHLAIILGKDAVVADPDRSRYYFMDNDVENQKNVIGAMPNTDVFGKEDTEISYKLLGEAPNRTLVVQYTNVYVALNWSLTEFAPVDLQIRLNETSNTIDLVFNGWMESIADYSRDIRVGLKGDNKDVHVRTYSDECDWQNTIKSTEDYEYDMLKWSANCNLVDGLTYTFIPCADCTTPTVQPTEFVANISTNTLIGSFSPVAGADHYLVLLSKTPLGTAEQPVDGKFYSTKDSIGEAVVLNYSADTTFTTLDEYGREIVIEIAPETKYYINVFASNSFCMYGPKYNTENPLVQEVTSLPAAPKSITITAITESSMTVTTEANASGHEVVVAYTDTPYASEYGTYLGSGLFSVPTGAVAVGDVLESGAKVVYVGVAGQPITINQLDANKVYYFAAFSKDANGNYSSLFESTENITDGLLPYEFAGEDMYYGITCGREMSSGVSIYNATKGFYFGPAQVGNEYVVSTQWLHPEQGTIRVVFDMNMYIWGRFGSTPYNEWLDNEYLYFEYTTNGIDWITAASIDKTNAPQYNPFDAYVAKKVEFAKTDDQPIKIRMRWIPQTANVRFYVKDLRIELKGECDYPINLVATDVVGDQATLAWEQQGTETEWVVNWRIAGTDEWTEEVTTTRSCKLTNLPGRSTIEARVAAKCSAESMSVWSNTISFLSGYVLPFTQGFDETFPNGWELKEGVLTETSTEFSEGVNWDWFSIGRMTALMFEATSEFSSWVLFPIVNFPDAAVNYNLSFTITNVAAGENCDEIIQIVVSKDGGATFKSTDVVYTVANADLPGNGETKTYTTMLKGLSGRVRVGLLVSGTTANTLTLDEVSIVESCPNDVVVKAEEILGTSATISWTGTKDENQEWMVFIRKAGETTREYQNTVDTFMVFNNLENRTAYEVGVTKACAADDVARPVIFQFTTAANDPCYPVETITATPAVFDVKLDWTGDAYAYNLRYRVQNTEAWTEVNTIIGVTYTITNLVPATTYEYQLQTLCSQAEGDYSEWTVVETVTTLAETCFAPANIAVESKHNRVVVTWEGDAAKFHVEYRLASVEEWTLVEVVDATTTTITGLTPETAYQLRMRSICSDTDMSRYSAIVAFSTTAIPECVVPSNPRVENITATSATLIWDADASNLTWDLNWRATSVTSWTEVLALTTATYELADLEPNTPYIWRVKATCEDDRKSGWSAQTRFTTEDSNPNAVENISIDDLAVYANAGILNILNPQGAYINNVAIYSITGALVGQFEVNAVDNIIIPTDIVDNIVIVKIATSTQVFAYKVVLK